MEADSYTLHFQIYVSAATSAADPTASEREGGKREGWKDQEREKLMDKETNNAKNDKQIQ